MSFAFLSRSALATLVAVGAIGFAFEASAQQLRFGTTQPGNVVAAGNTLGLAKQTGLNGPGTQDAIGTFISLDPNSVDNVPANAANPWGPNTTSDWTVNGSSASLALPVEASVLYAELVWGGSFQYGDENVLADLGASVTLSSDGDQITVSPDAGTGVTVNEAGSFPIRYYMRSNEVTQFIQTHGSGAYTVEGVPGTQSAATNTTNAAGWTLIVSYRYDSEPIRNMSVFVGGLFVDEDSTVDYPVSGFCAPPTTPIEGTIAIATLEGDANRVGDQLAIGETVADPSFILLSGPNNPVNNFFCSQINGPDGLVDTSGSFGTSNHETTDTNATPSQNTNNVSGARQGWDVAQLELTSAAGHLVPNQESAVLRTQTDSDSYMPVLAGIAIDVNAPKFLYENSGTTIDKDSVTLGDTFTVTANILNEGSAPANDVAFTLDLPNGIALTSFSTNGSAGDINGNTVTLPTLESGVDMGDIDTNQGREVELTLEVTAAQPSNIVIKPIWEYNYTICINDNPTNEVFNGKIDSITYVPEMGQGGAGGAGGSGGSGGAGGLGGQGGEGATGGLGGSGGGNEDAFPQGGGLFSCQSNSLTSSPSWFGGGALLGLLALASRRRRRS